MGWVLILAMWAGTLSKGDSVALTTVVQFSTETQCMKAGIEAKKKFATTFKTVEYVCVER